MKHIQRYRRMSLQISHAGGPYCLWTEPVDSFGSEIVARRIEDSFKRRSRHWTRLRQTHDLSIFTDGERRYGNLLFEICYELVNNGKPGRPKKTFKRGVHFRIKNKGSQAHKKGRKRLKYQSPWREHPDTARTIAETDIHANHTEAFWSALRRKCATFRRKTNMYAKATTGLQRLLRVYWVMHNFLRVHFTIREVPAVALGILERRLSVHEIFQIQMA